MQALESDIANFDKDRSARTKAAAAKLKAAKAGVEGARVAAREAAAVAMAAVAEQEAAEKEAAYLTAQISAASPAVEGEGLPQPCRCGAWHTSITLLVALAMLLCCLVL